MARQSYNSQRQIIDVTDFATIDFDEEVQVNLPKFAWIVARSYLSVQAQRLSSYAVNYFTNGYETPSAAQMDEIQANLADFLAAEVDVVNFLVGQIMMFGGSFLPAKFLWCNGQPFDALIYTELFSVIGYTFGVSGGDPLTPDMGERFPMGTNISHPRGEEGGEADHTLTVGEMPAHKHNAHWFLSGTGWHGGGNQVAVTHGAGTTMAGGGGSHNNTPEYLAVNFIIYAGQ